MVGQRSVVVIATTVVVLALGALWFSMNGSARKSGGTASPGVDEAPSGTRDAASSPVAADRTSANVQPVDSQPLARREIELTSLLEMPTIVARQAPHISRALASAYKLSERDDEGVSPEDVKRATESLISPLPSIDEPEESPEDGGQRRRNQIRLYNFLHPYIQEVQVDAAPIVIDFNCAIGVQLAASHPNSTVLCVHQVAKGALIPLAQPALKNLINFGTSSFVDPPFNNFYRSCNLISTSLLLSPANLCKDAHLKLIASMSKATFVLIPHQCRDKVVNVVASWTENPSANSSGTLYIVQDVAKVMLNGVQYRILRVVNKRSERICSKMWAGQKMFNRKIVMAYDDGLVRIRVVGKKASEGRTIHPLQYLPSVNLETIQMMGISTVQAERFFGQVVTTPQYSDPRPHNWVLTGGGRLARIDKYDTRFEAKHNESTFYWGVSTRGYFHFQGHHLCVPLQYGVPAIMSQEPCRSKCIPCVSTCSYLPRGRAPCEQCMSCGRCLEQSRMTAPPEVREWKGCQKLYGPKNPGPKLWKAWEKADRNTALPDV